VFGKDMLLTQTQIAIGFPFKKEIPLIGPSKFECKNRYNEEY